MDVAYIHIKFNILDKAVHILFNQKIKKCKLPGQT